MEISVSKFYPSKNSVSNSSRISYTQYEDLIYLSSKERLTFLLVYIFLFSIALLGNVAAILATCKRKQRFLQKTCVISLATSDIISSIVIFIYCSDNFVSPYVTWGLGNLLCYLVPSFKTFASLSSCAAIVIIALDRYFNVAKSRKNDPPIWICIIGAIIIGIICAGVAYPNHDFFYFVWFYVNYADRDSEELDISVAYLCISLDKDKLMIYNLSIAVMVFLPLILIFCWLYTKMAIIVWKHRKTFSKSYVPSSSTEVSTTQSSMNEITFSSSTSNPQVEMMIKRNKMKAERKIRTFKIIVVLVFVFVSCRLPFHIFDTLRTIATLSEHKHWIMRYAFNAINLLSCALNPFLYTFLNPTIKIWKKCLNALAEFLPKYCCCFCSNDDFADFENDNPFIIGTYDKKTNASTNTCYVKNQRFTRIKNKNKIRPPLTTNQVPVVSDIHKKY